MNDGRPSDHELVDVVDDGNRVVRVATRAEVRAGNLRHRSVFIAVVNRGRQLLVHERASWKDVWPSHWDVAFGGVLASGEDVVDGAARELLEEAGLEADRTRFEPLGEGTYEDELVNEHATIYLVEDEGPFAGQDGEVEQVRWVAVDDLDAWLGRVRCVPDSLALVVPRLRARFDLRGPS